MNLSAFTVKDIQELRETAKRMGYNRLANHYFYELMRRRTERQKAAA